MKLDVLQLNRRSAHRLRGRVLELRDVRFERFLLMRAVALPETEPHRHDDHQQNQQRGNEAELHRARSSGSRDVTGNRTANAGCAVR